MEKERRAGYARNHFGVSDEWHLQVCKPRAGERIGFRGLRGDPTGLIAGSVQESLSNANLAMRADSFENLYQALLALMSNYRMERTGRG